MTSTDKSQMQTDIAEIVSDDSLNVVIRRGSTSLAAQTVRIVRIPRSAKVLGNAQTGEARGDVLIVGGPNLDIQVDDRLNDGAGVVYRVVFIRPNRMVATEAEAMAVE